MNPDIKREWVDTIEKYTNHRRGVEMARIKMKAYDTFKRK